MKIGLVDSLDRAQPIIGLQALGAIDEIDEQTIRDQTPEASRGPFRSRLQADARCWLRGAGARAASQMTAELSGERAESHIWARALVWGFRLSCANPQIN